MVISTTNTITVLSVTAGANTIKGGVTALAANGWARFAYSAAVGAWVRTG